MEPLQLAGYHFDTGTILIPCIYLAHRSPEVFPDAKPFKPERFLNQKFLPYEYLPVGGGARGCIGMAFSMFEMKLVLANDTVPLSASTSPGTSGAASTSGHYYCPFWRCPSCGHA